MTITTIDRSACRVLRDALNEAVKSVADQYDVTIKAGSANFSPESVTFKVEVCVKGEDGQTQDKAAADFKQNAWKYGLSPDDLDREFSTGTDTYRLVGCKPRASKYPLIGERITDGKRFKFPPMLVKMSLQPA